MWRVKLHEGRLKQQFLSGFIGEPPSSLCYKPRGLTNLSCQNFHFQVFLVPFWSIQLATKYKCVSNVRGSSPTRSAFQNSHSPASKFNKTRFRAKKASLAPACTNVCVLQGGSTPQIARCQWVKIWILMPTVLSTTCSNTAKIFLSVWCHFTVFSPFSECFALFAISHLFGVRSL